MTPACILQFHLSEINPAKKDSRLSLSESVRGCSLPQVGNRFVGRLEIVTVRYFRGAKGDYLRYLSGTVTEPLPAMLRSSSLWLARSRKWTVMPSDLSLLRTFESL